MGGRMSVMKRWQLWLGIVISLVFLYFALRGLEFKDLGAALKQARYWWLIPGVIVYFMGVWVRAWRWHYLLRPIKSIRTVKLFPIVAIGYMGNNIYPARAGEFLRAVILKRYQDVPVSASLATIIVERIFDDVEVSKDNLIGKENEGWRLLTNIANMMRVWGAGSTAMNRGLRPIWLGLNTLSIP